MTADHFQQVFDTLIERRPFRPFIVKLGEGKRFEVDHPGALSARHGVGVFIAPGGVPIWFDHESVLTVVTDAAGASA